MWRGLIFRQAPRILSALHRLAVSVLYAVMLREREAVTGFAGSAAVWANPVQGSAVVIVVVRAVKLHLLAAQRADVVAQLLILDKDALIDQV